MSVKIKATYVNYMCNGEMVCPDFCALEVLVLQ